MSPHDDIDATESGGSSVVLARHSCTRYVAKQRRSIIESRGR